LGVALDFTSQLPLLLARKVKNCLLKGVARIFFGIDATDAAIIAERPIRDAVELKVVLRGILSIKIATTMRSIQLFSNMACG